jgi:hypothetical protein
VRYLWWMFCMAVAIAMVGQRLTHHTIERQAVEPDTPRAA